VVDVADPGHWNDRYESIGADRVSWFEDRPAVSLELLAALGVGPQHAVIDVGGGAASLVDHLLAAGHSDVTVLDVSAVALGEARTRLGDPAGVTWIEADLLGWRPGRRWDVWHDRAVLHFLTDDSDRATYLDLLRRALVPGGGFVIGTFAEDGPTQCSGLPVRRHSTEDLLDLLGDVEVVEQRRHVHRTPGDADQAFNWIAGRIR
jgi:SAM-dependent methyltransferase